MATVPEAYDQTTVYYANQSCGDGFIDVIFDVPVSNVQFLLENLTVDTSTTEYKVCASDGNLAVYCETQTLPSPGTVADPASTTTVFKFPYGGIRNLQIQPQTGHFSYLIDNMTVSAQGVPPTLPRIRRLLNLSNRLRCATGGAGPGAACDAIEASLFRFGYLFPTPTPTPSPSPCGAAGADCCLVPAAVPSYSCNQGSCDLATLKCP